MSTMTPQYVDGHWYVYEGYDALGMPVRVQVDAPTVEISAITEPVPDSPLEVFLPGVASHIPSKAKLNEAKKGLFYREPNHGKWYESAWWWFWVAVTGVFAIWWVSNMYGQTDLGDSNLEVWQQPDGMDYFIAYFGWLWWAWMPIGIGAVGALQKAGYKRFAALFAVALAGLIAAFFARSERAGR